MNKLMTLIAAFGVMFIGAQGAQAEVKADAPAKASLEAQVGQPAPDFTATDIHGQEVKLSSYKGKNIVLEWTNHECPFVVKHYSAGNMQATQNKAREMGVEWITIVSSAPGTQGHISPEQAKTMLTEQGANPSTKILDESGMIGKLYGAKTTPHMYVVNAEGTLVYAGAIDDNSSPNPETIEGATNYVLSALEALAAGQNIETAQTQPYGCSVKYAN